MAHGVNVKGMLVTLITALLAAIKNLSTLRRCCHKVWTTVKIRSTNPLPASLFVPKERLHQITALRSALSAALLVGSTPSMQVKVQRESSSLRILRQVRAVFRLVDVVAATSSSLTCCRTGSISDSNATRDRVPSRTAATTQTGFWFGPVTSFVRRWFSVT